MKKRLRKKLRVGEFREDCFDLAFSFDPPLSLDEGDAFWDAFIGEIERLGLACGGGSGPDAWSIVVQRAGRGTVNEAERALVVAWLDRDPRVAHVSAGPVRDGWH